MRSRDDQLGELLGEERLHVADQVAPQLRLQARRDLAGAKESTTTKSRFTIFDGPGQYYMRVAAADSSGEPISEFSRVAAVAGL